VVVLLVMVVHPVMGIGSYSCSQEGQENDGTQEEGHSCETFHLFSSSF
jgi:hypothetical protein